jgi:signal transduction histidine kinase
MLLMATWIVGVVVARDFADEYIQNVNRSIGMYVAERGPLLLGGRVNEPRLKEIAAQAMVLNPAARLFVLDSSGRVLWPEDRPSGSLHRVDLLPLRTALDSSRTHGPVYGDDPDRAERREIFSVAEIRSLTGLDGYVYITLDGAQQEGLLTTIGASYILKAALATTLLLLVVATLSALVLTRWVSRPLNRLHERILKVGTQLALAPAPRSAVPPGDVVAVSRVFDALAERVQQQVHELQSMDRLRRELLANVSHDLRTPLTAMRGYLETLAQDGDALSADRRAHFLAIIARHVDRLQRLVDQVFMLARLEAAAFPFRPEPMSVAELAQDVVSKWQLPAGAVGVRLQLDVDPRAPLVHADVGLLETVLENLIDNSIRHGKRGGCTIVAVRPDTRGARVTVTDDGCGIAAEDLPLLQQPFQAGRGGRSGLGLAIVRRVLEKHGSQLQIRSEWQQGTEILFVLPTIDGRRDEIVTIKPPCSDGAPRFGRSSITQGDAK